MALYWLLFHIPSNKHTTLILLEWYRWCQILKWEFTIQNVHLSLGYILDSLKIFTKLSEILFPSILSRLLQDGITKHMIKTGPKWLHHFSNSHFKTHWIYFFPYLVVRSKDIFYFNQYTIFSIKRDFVITYHIDMILLTISML